MSVTWIDPSRLSGVSASAVGASSDIESGGYRVITWTSSGSFSVASTSVDVDYLVVAGGGGGGGIATDGGAGGGGGGGVLTNLGGIQLPLANGNYAITVGLGGAGGMSDGLTAGTNGGNSSIGNIVTAIGGGGGGSLPIGQTATVGLNGGSGGGSAASGGADGASGGGGTTGQGNAGGSTSFGNPFGGGGGGAGAAGALRTGGNGLPNRITGISLTYAGGGGGGSRALGYGAAGAGGAGGGGAGGTDGAGTAGTDGLGGGGGGAGRDFNTHSGGDGGDGVVILRYKVSEFSPLSLSPALWLDSSDASTVIASNTFVSQWRDKSGNNRHVSQATPTNQPVIGAAKRNNKNVISFFGDDTLIGSWGATFNCFTVAAFTRINTGSSTLIVSLGGDIYPMFVTTGNAVAGYISANGAGSSNTLTSWSVAATSMTTSSPRVWLNGVLSTGTSTNSGSGGTLAIGSNGAGIFWLTGEIGEILMFTTIPSDSEIASLLTYLSAKWGVET